METRHALLRGAAALTLAVTIVGSAVLAPSASAAPLTTRTDNDTVHSIANKPKTESGKGENSGGDSGGGGALGNVPVIGGVIDSIKDAPPEQIVSDVVDFAQVAIPLVRSFLK